MSSAIVSTETSLKFCCLVMDSMTKGNMDCCSYFLFLFVHFIFQWRNDDFFWTKRWKCLPYPTHFLYLEKTHHLNQLIHFPHEKILDQTKMKAFADDKLNVTKMIISVFDRVENIVAKGEIACTSNFSFSHNVFKRHLFQTRQKASLCVNGLSCHL